MKTTFNIFWVRICAIALCVMLSPWSYAHIYAGDSDQYIRVIKHPELQDYYSYGVCQKNNYQTNAFARGVPMEQITSPNHLHADCAVPEGKYWWHLPNPETYSPVPNHASNLLDILELDDKGRGYLNTFEIATWILGYKAATKATSYIFKQAVTKRKFHVRALRWLGQFFLDATVDGAVTMAFWEAGRAISDKVDHDYYRKTQPFTEYKNWINETPGVNQAGIRVDNIGQLRIPKPFLPKKGQSCIEHCSENAFEIRNQLAHWYDKYSTLGLNKFANLPEDPNLAQEWLVYRSYPAICQLKCEQNYRMPTLEETWALQIALLAQANPQELVRVLFDHSAPWEDPQWRITYMTPQLISKHIGKARFGGACNIGSDCDQTHEMAQSNLASINRNKYTKISLKDLTQQYSKNVTKRLASPGVEFSRFHHYEHRPMQDSSTQGLPIDNGDYIKSTFQHVYPMGSTLIFDTEIDMQHIQIFQADQTEIFMDEYIQEEDRSMDLSQITKPGVYYILLPLSNDKEPILHKVVVGELQNTN